MPKDASILNINFSQTAMKVFNISRKMFETTWADWLKKRVHFAAKLCIVRNANWFRNKDPLLSWKKYSKSDWERKVNPVDY